MGHDVPEVGVELGRSEKRRERVTRPAAIVASAWLLFGMVLPCPAGAADESPAHSYSGSFLERSTLTGDWLGGRDYLATKGITLDADVTQVTQGVVSGGIDGAWAYGGRADFTLNVDSQKLGLWPGGFLTVELENNWGQSVNNRTGAINVPDSNQLFPIPRGDNVGLPNLSVAQFFSSYAGVVAGKLQTVSNSDENEFAHGKGDTQFLNVAFNINPVTLVVPYSTLGVGAIILPTADPDQAILSVSLLSATGSASTAGFDDLVGAIFAGEGRVRTDFFGLTGHQLLGAFYSNREYTSLDQRLGFVIQNRALAQHDGYWAVYYNFDQFLYETDASARHGVGLFGRFGASQGNPNPEQYFYSVGAGAKGIIPTRDRDQCGVGFYYASIRNPTVVGPLSTATLLRDEWGFETYYNLAVTPWLLLAPDVQVIMPTQKDRIVGNILTREAVNTAAVIGVRLQVIL